MGRVLVRYDAAVAGGELRADPAQRAVAERLDRCAAALAERPRKGSVLWRAFASGPSRCAASICGAASGAASRC